VDVAYPCVIARLACRCGYRRGGNVPWYLVRRGADSGGHRSGHHAEVVAHRVGEPVGTLILALAVTAIETALILSMMIAGGPDMAALPRDSIYAAS
jgi:hypothetical protein